MYVFHFYRDNNAELQSALEEDESISEPEDQNLTTRQNENENVPSTNESAFVTDNVNSSHSNDDKTKGI